MKQILQYTPVIKFNYAYSVLRQILSGWIGSGQKTIDIENKLCELTNNKYCVATTSGTTALFMAIHSLNIPKNKKIILPSYTFIAPHNATKFLGYDIILIDINPETMCLDYNQLVSCYNKYKTKIGAIIYVTHNSYSGVEYTQTLEFCKHHNIPLIEDSSQSLGNTQVYNGDLSIISFSVPKIVTSGQGGAIVTNNEALYNNLRMLQDHGDNWRKNRIHENLGVNFKFNDILSAFLLPQLNSLDKLIKTRNKIFDEYRKYIKLIDFSCESTWMVIYKTEHVKEIINELKNNNISAVQYYKPINWNPPYNDNIMYQNAEFIYNNYLYLPSSLNLSKKDIKRICNIILKIESKYEKN